MRTAQYRIKVHALLIFEADTKNLLSIHEVLAECSLMIRKLAQRRLSRCVALVTRLATPSNKTIGLLAAVVEWSDDAIL